MPRSPVTAVALRHRLLAVFAADAAGYSRLMADDDLATVEALDNARDMFRHGIADHNGRVIDTAGDSVLAVFDTALGAVEAAVAIQRLLANWAAAFEPHRRMRFRIGIDLGDVIEKDDGTVYGDGVNIAARLQALAEPGGVNVSRAIHDAVARHAGMHFDDLGEQRVKNIAHPVQTFGLWLDAPPALPAAEAPSEVPSNLPQPLTSFIGREQVIAEVTRLLREARLLTLTGPGGAGKSRLSIRVATLLLPAYPGGVWWVALAALGDPELVPQALAKSLGLRETAGGGLMQSLTERLTPEPALLVLDNCEHLTAACASLADTLLHACAKLAILASSREALAIDGERVYRVPPLSVPDPVRDVEPQQVAASEAARLFIERAQLHSRHFAVTEQNAAALASVCQRLDGMPLALELSAARVRSMSVEEVNQRLDRRFALLTGGPRTAQPRQQTLRALIDWSYDLLSETEKALLGRLSVFAGGWTLPAAQRVCTDAVVDEADVLDLLTSLADKSLLSTHEHDGATRYHMLETMREYAHDRLREGANEAHWNERHCRCYFELAMVASAALNGAEQAHWLPRLETEHDNLRAALAWCSRPGDDAVRGLQLAAALGWFWFVHGYITEGRNWLTTLLDAVPAGEADATRASAIIECGNLARIQGDYAAARTLNEQALALYRRLDDRDGVATAQSHLGLVAYHLGDYDQAKLLLDQSLAAQRAAGNHRGAAMSLNSLGMMACDRGEYGDAQALHRESLAIRRELSDRQGIAVSLNNLGIVVSCQGDADAARALYEENLAIRRELGDRRGIALSLFNLGQLTHQQGEKARAAALLGQALVAFRAVGDRRGIALSLSTQGELAVDEGDLVAAERLYAESLGIQYQAGDRLAVAQLLELLARLRSLAGDAIEAGCMWGAAQALREAIGAPLPLADRADYERRVDTARKTAEDADSFELAWQQGRALSIDQAVDRVMGTSRN
jgi:non-specific serine/threonine protein kinase